MSTANRSNTGGSRKRPFLQIAASWGGLLFGSIGALLGTLAYLQSIEDHNLTQNLQVERKLDQAWDLIGGKPGTSSISTLHRHEETGADDLELALRLVQEAQLIDQDSDHAFFVLAAICAIESDYECAVEKSRQAVELDGEDRRNREAYAGMLYFAGEYVKALEEMEATMRMEGLDGKVDAISYQLYGELLRTNGKLEDAEKALGKALAMAPDDLETLGSMGFLQLELGNEQTAESYFQKMVRLYPDLSLAVYRLGEFYRKSQRFEEAHVAYSQALEIDPGNFDALYSAGYALFEQGEFERAKAAFQDLINLKPNAESYFAFGLVLLQLEDEEAIRMIRKALELEPENSHYQNWLGEALTRLEVIEDHSP